MMAAIHVEDFPRWTSDKIRYADTDRQGHVNNAVFAVLLETGRAEILYNSEDPFAEPGSSFVIARLVLDFVSEIRWPGIVSIGTRVVSIGRSAVTLDQALLQDDRVVARSETVIVLIDEATRKPRSLSVAATRGLSSLMSNGTRQEPLSKRRKRQSMSGQVEPVSTRNDFASN
jgi:acyl-CoA thioester hydrolase